MNKIDEYIDSIYKKFSKNNEEVKELKEEMKSHIYDKVAELKAKGNTEEESVKIAIEDFGEENKVAGELEQVIRKQNWVFKLLTKLAILSFILGSICLTASWVTERAAIENWQKSKPITADVVVEDSILKVLTKEQDDDPTTKSNLTKTLNDFNDENYNGLYAVKVVKDNMVVFEYSRAVPQEMIINGSESSINDRNGLSIQYRTTDFEEMRQRLSWESLMDIHQADNLIHNKLEKLSFRLFLVFWILMLVHFIQKTFLKNFPDKVFQVLLVVETLLVLAPLTYTDHQYIMIIAIIIFSLLDMIYQGKKSARENTEYVA